MSWEAGGDQTSQTRVWTARLTEGTGGSWVSYEAATEHRLPFSSPASVRAHIQVPPPEPPQVEQQAVRASGSAKKLIQAHSWVTFGKLPNLSEPVSSSAKEGRKSTYLSGRITLLSKGSHDFL